MAKTTFLQIIISLLLFREPDPLMVNTVADVLNAGPDQVTLRQALQDAKSGDVITFADELDGSGDPQNRYNQDIFTGSLVHFKSRGYNLTGVIDFSQILVPVGEFGWKSLSRKHYPREGDINGVDHGDVVDLTNGVSLSDFIVSQGVGDNEETVLRYQPQSIAVDSIPENYEVTHYFSDYLFTSKNFKPDTA